MYDERLAERIRFELAGGPPFSERKMFGGLSFMVKGHMTCGAVKDELLVRTGPEQYESALLRPHARPMDFTGRPMRGMVMVAPKGLEGNGLREWVALGIAYVTSLPAK